MISRCVYAFLSVRFVADGLSAAEAGVVLVVCTLVTNHLLCFWRTMTMSMRCREGMLSFVLSFVSFPLFLDTSKGDWFDARAGPFLSFCPGVKDPLLARRERLCSIRLPRGQGVGRVYEDEAVGRLSAVSLPSLPPPPVLQPVFPLSLIQNRYVPFVRSPPLINMALGH